MILTLILTAAPVLAVILAAAAAQAAYRWGYAAAAADTRARHALAHLETARAARAMMTGGQL